MKVLIAAVSAASELSGVQRHAFNLASCLLGLQQTRSVDLVIAPWQHEMTKRHAPVEGSRMRVHVESLRNSSVARNAWFYNRLPTLARQIGVDIVHVAYPVALRRGAFKSPVVVTLHDLYVYEAPRNFGPVKAWLNRRILNQCLRSADAIACVSSSTLCALRRYAAPPLWQKASRIYNSVEPGLEEPRRPLHLLHEREQFLLCVAQHRHNKNIDLLLRSFRHLLKSYPAHSNMRLLVIGISGPETPHIRGLLVQLGIADRVTMAEGLSDAELQWCYKNCACLVMPSLMEGFGLPAVEALEAGCRVVCSDIPALREIGGSHCYFVPLAGDAVPAFADAIGRVLQLPVPKPISFPEFSMSEIAAQYLTLYRGLVDPTRLTDTLAPPRGTYILEGQRYE